jgi:CzcA family heavy metal efflux pump
MLPGASVAIFPQTDFPRVVIIVDNGVAPLRGHSFPLRVQSSDERNTESRTSIKTARGSSEISLYFYWGVDIVQVLQLVQARLSQLSSSLPSGNDSQRRASDLRSFPVSGYSLTSEKRDQDSLRDIATYIIRPQLARLPGVAIVGVAGGETREFQVTIDPDRLAAHNVSVQQVADAIRASNLIASPGLIEENHQLELLLISGQAKKAEELNGIVVASVNNAPVKVADVATVSSSVEPEYTMVTADGRPAALVNINRQPDANTLAVVDEVRSTLAKMRGQIPADVRVATYYDQSLLVRDSINSVRDSILIGLLLSVAILYAFLRNWGTTFVAILVIPVTVLITFLAMWLARLSFDLMTLGGVAAAIGLLIDDAIVVVENIYTHISRGQPRREAVQSAVSEIAVPIIGSTITPVVVFLPLTILSGVTGVFIRSLALTMSVALLTSLALALGFTPILAERFVKARRRGAKEYKEDQSDHQLTSVEMEEEAQSGTILRAVVGRYERVLSQALDRRWIVIVVVVAALVGSYLLYRSLGSEFLPQFDESAFVLDYRAPSGSSLTETDRLLQQVEKMLHQTPEVESYSRRTGLEMGLFVTEPNTGDFAVKLKPGHKRATKEVESDLREQIARSVPALQVEFVGIVPDVIGDLQGNPEPIQIKLFSEDAAALEAKADEVETAIKDIPGIVDTNNGVIVSGPAITFKVDPQRASQFGITADDVAKTAAVAITGDEASFILQQDRLIKIRVIFPPDVRTSLDKIRAIQVRSPSGTLLRIDQVADVEFEKGQTEIGRENLRQTVAVTGQLEGKDLGTAINDIRTKLAKQVKLPPGMTIEYGGLYQEQQSSFRELVLSLVLAVLLVFITLLIEFRSFAHPIAIVTGAVLALAGVLLALFVTGQTLNVVSLMGMIMIVGIVSKNGILMLDAVEDHLPAGDTLREALLRSGRRRFRPVLMTSRQQCWECCHWHWPSSGR